MRRGDKIKMLQFQDSKEAIKIKNAIITNTEILVDEPGCLSVWLYLEYEQGSQGFGGYALYLPEDFMHHNIRGLAGHFIYRCLKIAGVKKWDELKEKAIRVKASHSKVYAIGHIIKDDWFEPGKDFENLLKGSY